MKKLFIFLIFVAITSFIYPNNPKQIDALIKERNVKSRSYRNKVYAMALEDESTAGLLLAVTLVGEGNYHRLEQRYNEDNTGRYLWLDLYRQEPLHTYRARFEACRQMAAEQVPPLQIKRAEPKDLKTKKIKAKL